MNLEMSHQTVKSGTKIRSNKLTFLSTLLYHSYSVTFFTDFSVDSREPCDVVKTTALTGTERYRYGNTPLFSNMESESVNVNELPFYSN